MKRSSNATATARDVALLMRSSLDELGELSQGSAAYLIEKVFGPRFVYRNRNSNLAIDKQVLNEFHLLTLDCVWLRTSRKWRPRKETDRPGRSQDG